MGKVVVNGVEYRAISDIRTKFGAIELCKSGWYECSITVNNPIIVLQQGSANHVRAYDSVYIKQGNINQINAHDGYFDNVDFVLEVYYERNGRIPDIDSYISSQSFSKEFTPVVCSGKFDTISSNIEYSDFHGLSIIVSSTRGCIDMVSSGAIVYSRVSPVIGFTGLTVYSPTF